MLQREICKRAALVTYSGALQRCFQCNAVLSNVEDLQCRPRAVVLCPILPRTAFGGAGSYSHDRVNTFAAASVSEYE